MRELLWRLVAFIVTRPAITSWLIERAQRTPFKHIEGKDGSLYMGRWWLFNPYEALEDHTEVKRWQWLPSVRVHHIMRPDSDRDLHDHPWNARTIVLRSWYAEVRPGPGTVRTFHLRKRGYTGRLLFGQYHRISTVPEGGVWTLFFTWRKQGTWGFNVHGVKVPHDIYLGDEA